MKSLELAFIQDNARMEPDEVIVNNFIPTDQFWKLFTTNHQVLCGSRGSGKTALTKMASYPFLKHFNHPDAQEIVRELRTIGVFVNTDIRFVGSLRNKHWNNPDFGERYFIWKFNINCFKALLSTLSSILKNESISVQERISTEIEFVEQVTEALFQEKLNIRLADLPDYVSDYEFETRQKINHSFLNGEKSSLVLSDYFSTELLEPIQFTIRCISNVFSKLKQSNWLFFVDEGEYLTEDHHRILNSFMRTNPERIFIKLATLPFHHHTLDTNLDVHLQPDEDFEYLYLDSDPIQELNSKSNSIYKFAESLFNKRIVHFIEQNELNIPTEELELLGDLNHVLGPSPESNKFRGLKPGMSLKILSEYLNDKALERAKKRLIVSEEKFDDEILRKVKGLIFLIDDKRAARGNTAMEAYSGLEMAIRCTDGVPRRMINLFQDIARLTLLEYYRHAQKNRRTNMPILPKKKQCKLLKAYSEKRFLQTISVPKIGPDLQEFIKSVADYFSHKIHNEKISTDVIGSFSITKNTSDKYWKIVQTAVAFGFVFPNTVDRAQDVFSNRKGSFRLSFSLCPYFSTYPRRGESRTLDGIMRAYRRHNTDSQQVELDLDGHND